MMTSHAPHWSRALARGGRLCTWALLLGVLGVSACRSSAGMYCQDQADCRAGLTCSKPRTDGGAAAYGVCITALLGTGQVCLRSDECDVGLRCSTAVGVFVGDDYHGRCEAQPDLAPPPRDASSGEDAAPADGSADL